MPLSSKKRMIVKSRMTSYASLWAGFMHSLDTMYGIENGAGTPDIEWRLSEGAVLDDDGIYKVPVHMRSNGVTVNVTFFWPDEEPEKVEAPVLDIALA